MRLHGVVTASVTLTLLGCTGNIFSPGAPGAVGPFDPTGTGSGGGGVSTGPTRLDCSGAPHAAVSEGRRITAAQYANAIGAVFGGGVAASAQFPGSYGTPVTGFSTEPAINDVGSTSIDSILLAAEDVALALQPNLASILPCVQSAPDDTCAGTFIDTYIRRAYRRAPTPDERASLMSTLHNAQSGGASFTEAVCMMTAHALQSPAFVYVLEDAAPMPRALSGEEIASRLSFLLWDSIPDDVLLDAAQSGALATPDQWAAQAQRMLDVSGADGAMTRFFREWTATAPLKPDQKDPAVYPYLTDALAASINASFDRFASGMIRDHGTLTDTLTGTSAFVDEQLASFFGVPAPPAGQWQKLTLEGAPYAGVMTQPAMLASLAHMQKASFVLRGKFIRARLLCMPLGSPPANAQAVFAGLTLPPNPTGKEVAAGIESYATCAGCHKIINPPGLAFENFDAVGHYQAQYPSGRAIDPSGTMSIGSDTLTFDDPTQLMQQLAERPEPADCVDRQLFRFALSRNETTADACALQTMGDALTASHGELRSALIALVTSDSFTWKADP
jgi:hypothetical protein